MGNHHSDGRRSLHRLTGPCERICDCASDPRTDLKKTTMIKALQFTKFGKPVGPKFKPPQGANDVHLVWRGPGRSFVIVVFTKDGEPIGATIAPPKANDVGFAWEESITQGFWTRDGENIAPVPIPPGANDVHLYILGLGGRGRIVKAFWTQNRKPIKPIPVPPGANDAHLA